MKPSLPSHDAPTAAMPGGGAASRSFGVGRKLLMAFLSVVVLIGVVGVVGLSRAGTLNGHTNDIYNNDVANFEEISNVGAQLAEIQADAIRAPGLQGHPVELKRQLGQFAGFDKNVNDRLDTIDQRDAGQADISAAVAALRAAIGDYNEIRDTKVLGAVQRGDFAAAAQAANTELDAITEPVLKAQKTLADAQKGAAADSHSSSQSVFKGTRTLLIALTLLALLFSVAIAGTLSRKLTRRMARIIAGTRAVAAGDLTHRVDVQSRDELQEMATSFNELTERLQLSQAAEVAAREEGQRSMVTQYETFARRVAGGDLTARVNADGGEFTSLAGNMNDMVQGLGGMSGEVRDAAKAMAGATSQILAVVSQHNAASSEQAAAIAETSVTVDEVRATAHQAAERAQMLADQALTAAAVSVEGRAAVEGITEGMGAIRAKVEEIARDIRALSDRARAIQDITETVNGLADQSNMLALNATIEAAKAGEHGRGFAVVADEVRLLAEQSKAATAQVRAILAEIQQASDKAVMAAEQGTRVVEAGAAGAREAGLAIERIGETVQETAQVASQIAASAKEQSVGMEQIGQAMTDVATTTHQIASGADQTHDAARSLADLAERLEALTSRYIIDGARSGDPRTQTTPRLAPVGV